jgi:uncharacterized protein (DUF1697 family)
MKTWIALLRGINIGGRHKVPMKELVRLMEARGFADVRTYIQSGNVVFRSPTKSNDEIGRLIERHFGFKPKVFVLSPADLEKAMAANPYKTGKGNAVHFFFCDKRPASVDHGLLESLREGSEEYRLVGNVFYLHAPNGVGRSKLVEKMGKAFTGVSMTARNLNTVTKLAAMIGG